MKELLAKGIVPVQHEIAEGRLKKQFFGGPPPTKEGFWNDIRGRDEEVALGLARVVALDHRSSALYQIHEPIRCLLF